MSRDPKVVDFSLIANRKRISESRDKLGEVLDNNKEALTRLFRSGKIFEEEGIVTGRDLLLAHQYLMRILKLIRVLDKMEGKIDYQAQEVQLLFVELDDLLQKASDITTRTGTLIPIARKH